MDCNTASYEPFVVPGLSTSSSSSSPPTSPTSSSQEAVTPTEHPAPTRSESKSEEIRGNSSHGPAETESPNKNEDNEEVRGNSSHDLPEWLREFRHGLVDESVPEHRDAFSSHEVPSKFRAKVASGKHSIFTHFPKDRNSDCWKTQITRASCRKRTGTVVLRAQFFGDLVTADHQVLSEGCESRHNHRYAVVVQDLATQWIQSYPCKTKNFPGNTKELTQFFGADEETKSHLHRQFFGIRQSL